MKHPPGPVTLKSPVPPKLNRTESHSLALQSLRTQTWTARVICFGLTALLALCGGCTRKYWREQADDLSYDIIKKKEVDPRWTLPRIDVLADPRSRFFDPYDPDFTPLPPDDPAAHDYMHWVYGMNGYRKWHDFGDLPAAENPDWLQPFGLSQDVVAANYSKSAVLPQIEKLTLEEAVELSWVHSRDYQTQIENVYLVALALTLQRFQFDLQFIGFSGRPSSEVTQETVPNTADSLNLNNSVGVSQLFPSGAQFIAELANNTLWIFSPGKSDSTASVLSYSLVQPLLANGGRRFVLEGLTQAERNMLYAIRDLARYRMGFFTTAVAGGGTAGLTSGVTQAAAAAINALNSPVSSGGYLGLLQQMQVIYNQEYNISQLKEQLDRIHSSVNLRREWIGEELKHLPTEVAEPPPPTPEPPKEDEAAEKNGEEEKFVTRAPPKPVARILNEDVIPPEIRGQLKYSDETDQLYLRGTLTDAQVQQLMNLSPDPEWKRVVSLLATTSVAETETVNQQLAQLQTQLAQNCNSLRQSRVTLQNSIDQYKLFLGLPTDMPISIDDSVLKPFEFIDARLLRLQDRLKAFVPEPPEISDSHPDAEAMRRAASLLSRFDPAAPDISIIRGLVEELERLQEDIRRDGINVLENDFERYTAHVKAATNKPPSDNCFIVYRDAEANSKLKTSLLARFDETVANLDAVQKKLTEENLTSLEIDKILTDISETREDFLKITRSLSVVQINVRVDLIDLNRFDLDRDESVAVGLENRMDLMNARAQVMDARRNVEVAANQLQAVLNIVAAGDVRTQPLGSGNGNPLDFRGDQTSLRAGVQFTSPVQLVQQRNVYRAALISYQRARRNYMRIEDQVKYDLRTTWRQLNLQQLNFETAREQVRAAAAQLDIVSELSTAPVVGNATAAGAGGSVQGLNTLNALSAVLQAQNQMIQIWVNFESNRLQIYNFMGTMEVDENGFWVDEFYQRRALAARAGRNLDDLPPSLPSELTPTSPPQELKNEPVDATEIAPQPQPTDARRSPVKRDAETKHVEKLQLVKGEFWPERPDPAKVAPRGGRKGARDPADPPVPRRGRGVGVEREESLESGRAERSDRRNR